MNKLILDIGNTLAKVALFSGKQIKEVMQCPSDEADQLLAHVLKLDFSVSILSAVRDYPEPIKEHLLSHGYFLELNEHTKIPIRNAYMTPATLGKDRLAAACGAYALFPGDDVLVVNAGTCITYDVVTAGGVYQGGSISPGLQMRLKALHTFTGRLPLLSSVAITEVPGKSTEDSILTGAYLGAAEEIKGMIQRYRQIYPALQAVLSGGDSLLFENQLKSGIFVVQNIVLLGLNEILDDNV